jgi:SAM-dependent methyltransferase
MSAVDEGRDSLSELRTESTDVEFYRTAEAVEGYSTYYLLPQEKELFLKYYRPGQTVLDLACGLGRTTVPLHEMGMEVRAIDLSDVLIARAQQRFPYIRFDVGSYTDIDAQDNSYDHVLISFNSIDHAHPVSARVRAIQESFRVLKPGGTFIYSSHNIKAVRFSPFLFRRVPWMLRNSIHSRHEQAYIADFGLHLSYAAPEYVIRQTTAQGFDLMDVIGFRGARRRLTVKYFAPYVHYAWRKPVGS